MTLKVSILKLQVQGDEIENQKEELEHLYGLKSEEIEFMMARLSKIYSFYHQKSNEKLLLFLKLIKDGGKNDEVYQRALRFLKNSRYNLRYSLPFRNQENFNIQFYSETNEEISVLLDFTLLAWFYNSEAQDVKQSVEKLLIAIDKYSQFYTPQIPKQYMLRDKTPFTIYYSNMRIDEQLRVYYNIKLASRRQEREIDIRFMSDWFDFDLLKFDDKNMFDSDLDLCNDVIIRLYSSQSNNPHPYFIFSSASRRRLMEDKFSAEVTPLLFGDYLFQYNCDFMGIYIGWFEEYLKVLELIRLHRNSKRGYLPIDKKYFMEFSKQYEHFPSFGFIIANEDTGFYERKITLRENEDVQEGLDDYSNRYGISLGKRILNTDMTGIKYDIVLGDSLKTAQSDTDKNTIKYNGKNAFYLGDKLLLSIRISYAVLKQNKCIVVERGHEFSNYKGYVDGKLDCLAYFKRIFEGLKEKMKIRWTAEQITAVYLIGLVENSLESELVMKYRHEIEAKYTRQQIVSFIADTVSRLELQYQQTLYMTMNLVAIELNNLFIYVMRAYKQDTLEPVIIIVPGFKQEFERQNYIPPVNRKDPIYKTHVDVTFRTYREKMKEHMNIYNKWAIRVKHELDSLLWYEKIPETFYRFFNDNLRLQEFVDKYEKTENDNEADQISLEYGRWYIKEGMPRLLSIMNINPNETLVNIARKITRFMLDRFGDKLDYPNLI